MVYSAKKIHKLYPTESSSKPMRSCLITHSLALALCVSVLTNADTVTLNGAQYTNVYVSPGTALYYIRFADDGTQISVPKSVLSERDIRISRDATARTKIMDAWKLKRDEFPIHERKTLTYTEWKERFKEPSTAVPPPIVSPAPDRIRALTNSHDRLARSTTKGKVFMDSEGTRIMTNAPGRFENNKEYRLTMSANARKKYDNHYKYDTVINKIIDVYYEAKTSISKNE